MPLTFSSVHWKSRSTGLCALQFSLTLSPSFRGEEGSICTRTPSMSGGDTESRAAGAGGPGRPIATAPRLPCPPPSPRGLTVDDELHLLLHLRHVIQVQDLAAVQPAAALVDAVQAQHPVAGVGQGGDVLPVLGLRAGQRSALSPVLPGGTRRGTGKPGAAYRSPDLLPTPNASPISCRS